MAFSLKRVDIENFKYFIAGLGALPVAILYSFLRLNYKLTSNWIFLLFIALAFLCGHYLWVFAKSFFFEKRNFIEGGLDEDYSRSIGPCYHWNRLLYLVGRYTMDTLCFRI